MNRNDKLNHLRRILSGKITRFLPTFSVKSIAIRYNKDGPSYAIEGNAATEEEFKVAKEQWENLPEESKVIINVVRHNKSRHLEPGRLDRKLFSKLGN